MEQRGAHEPLVHDGVLVASGTTATARPRPMSTLTTGGIWKVLAYGGNGLNFYMLHGGTNFASWNNDEDAVELRLRRGHRSGGRPAPDLLPLQARRPVRPQLSKTILEDSDNATDAYKARRRIAGIRVTARKVPAGTILFLDNTGKSANQNAGERGRRHAVPICGAADGRAGPDCPDRPRLCTAAGRDAGALHAPAGHPAQGSTTTLVAYGPPGDVAEMRFRVAGR